MNLYKQARALVLQKQSLYTDMADSADCPNSRLVDAEFNHLDKY